MCTCGGGTFESDYDTVICIKCGIEIRVPMQITNNNSNTYYTHTPFMVVYSRFKRFSSMLENIFYPNSTASDDNVMKFLFKHKPIKNIDEICKLLKATKCKDKRYCSLHLWARLCVPSYKAPQPPPDWVKKHILFKFKEIEFLHKRYAADRPFFNYCWLIRKLMYLTNCHQHMRFVKKLKCSKRRKIYQRMFEELTVLSRKDEPISAYV